MKNVNNNTRARISGQKTVRLTSKTLCKLESTMLHAGDAWKAVLNCVFIFYGIAFDPLTHYTFVTGTIMFALTDIGLPRKSGWNWVGSI